MGGFGIDRYINRAGKMADFGHKQGKGFRKAAGNTTLAQFFWEHRPLGTILLTNQK